MKIIEVVVGLIFNDAGEILVAWRDASKTPGHCWEFPGGKIEQGESGYQALSRELLEEVGIEVQAAEEMFSIRHGYEINPVNLHVWRLRSYRGIPQGAEGQVIAWVAVNQLRGLTLPLANQGIVDWLLAQQKPIFSA